MVLIFALLMILASRTAIQLYDLLGFLEKQSAFFTALSKLRTRISPLAALGILSFCAYRIVPVNAPSALATLQGTLFCVIPFGFTSLALHFFISQTRYNFLYGALGNLIILLVNVYLFFTFFFFGAQTAFVIDSFEALFFSKFRQARTETQDKQDRITRKFFSSINGKMEKYIRFYKKGETVFLRGDKGKEIYYLLSGEAEIFIAAADNTESLMGTLKEGGFFGEMEHLINEDRSAAVRAKTNMTAIALPPELFEKILKYDPETGRAVIEILSQRLKNADEQFKKMGLV
jgi:membrane protein